MTRDYDIESILGVPFEETPETLAYDLSAQFSSQVSQRLDEAGMTLKELSEKMGVEMPICESAYGVLYEGRPVELVV